MRCPWPPLTKQLTRFCVCRSLGRPNGDGLDTCGCCRTAKRAWILRWRASTAFVKQQNRTRAAAAASVRSRAARAARLRPHPSTGSCYDSDVGEGEAEPGGEGSLGSPAGGGAGDLLSPMPLSPSSAGRSPAVFSPALLLLGSDDDMDPMPR